MWQSRWRRFIGRFLCLQAQSNSMAHRTVSRLTLTTALQAGKLLLSHSCAGPIDSPHAVPQQRAGGLFLPTSICHWLWHISSMGGCSVGGCWVWCWLSPCGRKAMALAEVAVPVYERVWQFPDMMQAQMPTGPRSKSTPKRQCERVRCCDKTHVKAIEYLAHMP